MVIKLMPAGPRWAALALGLLLYAAAPAQSPSVHDPGAPVALQALLNQGFEVKAAATGASGLQMLYLQKASLLYACALQVAGVACGRIGSR
jgi:hypothetical protein